MPSNLKPNTDLNAQRRRAVQLRLSGNTLANVRAEVGLSTPTIIAAVKAFKVGGWPAVDVKPRGRPRLDDAQHSSTAVAQAALLKHLGDNPEVLWSSNTIRTWLKQNQQLDVSLQTTASYLQSWQLLPENQLRMMKAAPSNATKNWLEGDYKSFINQAKRRGATLLWLGTRVTPTGLTQLHAHTLRGRCLWMSFSTSPARRSYADFLTNLLNLFPKGLAVVVPNKNIEVEVAHFAQNSESQILCTLAHPMPSTSNTLSKPTPVCTKATPQTKTGLTHLERLEAQSIQILREVIAQADNPVMLYSAGKDSAVMLHLARKAFFPAKPPLPMLHIDTTWKFQEIIRFRDKMVAQFGLTLLTHTNTEGVSNGVNPFSHGSRLHTDIMKTAALKQALDEHHFDVAVAGVRRDEQMAQAKERVFSSRSTQHSWDPKQQRPEIWNLYNTHKHANESIRAFPLSNWSELDIWQYIHQQSIPVVPLYFAAERPVVERYGSLVMVDDERMPLNTGEVPMMRSVRFRTLDCYPLSSGIESSATTVAEIIEELLHTTNSEQQGRMTDHDSAALIEKRKQEGHF